MNVKIVQSDIQSCLTDIVNILNKENGNLHLLKYEKLTELDEIKFPKGNIPENNYVLYYQNKISTVSGVKTIGEDVLNLHIKNKDGDFKVDKKGFAPLFMYRDTLEKTYGSTKSDWSLLTYDTAYLNGIGEHISSMIKTGAKRANKVFSFEGLAFFVNKMRAYCENQVFSRNGTYKIQNRVKIIPDKELEGRKLADLFVDSKSKVTSLTEFIKEYGILPTETGSFNKGMVTFRNEEIHEALRLTNLPSWKDGNYDYEHPFKTKTHSFREMKNKESDRRRKLNGAESHELHKREDNVISPNEFMFRDINYLTGKTSNSHLNLLVVIDPKEEILNYNSEQLLHNVINGKEEHNIPIIDGIAGQLIISEKMSNTEFIGKPSSFRISTPNITPEFKAFKEFIDQNPGYVIRKGLVNQNIMNLTSYDWGTLRTLTAGYTVKCCNSHTVADEIFKTFTCTICQETVIPNFDKNVPNIKKYSLGRIFSNRVEIRINSITPIKTGGYKISYLPIFNLNKQRVVDPEVEYKGTTVKRSSSLLGMVTGRYWDERLGEYKEISFKPDGITTLCTIKGGDAGKHIMSMRFLNSMTSSKDFDTPTVKCSLSDYYIKLSKEQFIDLENTEFNQVMKNYHEKSEFYWNRKVFEPKLKTYIFKKTKVRVGILSISLTDPDFITVANEKPVSIGSSFETTLNLMGEHEMIKALKAESPHRNLDLFADLTSIIYPTEENLKNKPRMPLSELLQYKSYIDTSGKGDINAYFEFIREFPLFKNKAYENGAKIEISLTNGSKIKAKTYLVTPSVKTLKSWVQLSNEVNQYTYLPTFRKLLSMLTYIRYGGASPLIKVDESKYNEYLNAIEVLRKEQMLHLVRIELFGCKSKLISSAYIPPNHAVISSKTFWNDYFNNSDWRNIYANKKTGFFDFMHDVVIEKIKIYGLNFRFPLVWMTQHLCGTRVIPKELANIIFKRTYICDQTKINLFDSVYDIKLRKFFVDHKTPALYKNYQGGMLNEFETCYRDMNDNDGDIFQLAVPLTLRAQMHVKNFTEKYSLKELIYPQSPLASEIAHNLKWHLDHFEKELHSNCDMDIVTKELAPIQDLKAIPYTEEERLNAFLNSVQAQSNLGFIVASMWKFELLFQSVFKIPQQIGSLKTQDPNWSGIVLTEKKYFHLCMFIQILTQDTMGIMKGDDADIFTLQKMVNELNSEESPSDELLRKFLEQLRRFPQYLYLKSDLGRIVRGYANSVKYKNTWYYYIESLNYMENITKKKSMPKRLESIDDTISKLKSRVNLNLKDLNTGVAEIINIL